MQPDPAREVICSIGGMESKSGTAGTVGGEDEGKDSVYRRGGRCIFWDRSKDCFSCLWRLLTAIGVAAAGDRRWIGRFPGASGNDDDDEGEHSIAAAATFASADRPLAMASCREAGFSLAPALHLHFHRLLQLHGFSKESTAELLTNESCVYGEERTCLSFVGRRWIK